MNLQLQHQKVQMLKALNYLDLVDICEQNIKLGNNVKDYEVRKKDYANKYAETMAAIVGDAITISKTQLFY